MGYGMAWPKRFCAASVLLVFALVIATPADAQGSRVALVVGVGAYRTVPQLANPPRDA